ncbi:NAD-dependent epimerase/dehydratase family protein [Candidatus Dependentiae bacterium]
MKHIEKFYKNKRVLVTGGAGFIGSYIVEELIKNNAKVTILDNFSSGNINNLYNNITEINIIYGDITNPFTCLKATKNIDIVFHLAALISVPLSTKNPQKCNLINIEGTKNLLEACRKNDVKKFIFSSSSAVYGNKKEKCNEDDKVNPESQYAKSKVAGEEICKYYYENYGINTTCLRYFNVYGERQNPNGNYAAVVAKFTHNLKTNTPIVIYGDGKQTRDFIHVSEVAKANLKISIQPNLNGDVFNIATGKSINLLELIDQLEKEINTKKTKLILQPERTGDIKYSVANCEKYKKLELFNSIELNNSL